MLVLDEADIAKLLDMDAALTAVRTALMDVYRGAAVNLARERASLHGQTLHSTGAPARAGTRPEARPETRPGPGAITVFCSHGVGSWDLELARIALERAEATGTGHRLGLDMGQWRDGQ